MTCIIGLEHNGIVHLCGDSLGSSGWFGETRNDPKVFTVGKFAIGFTSSFRMGQILMYAFVPPDHPETLNDHAYLCTLFVDSIRQLFKDKGYSKSDSGEESAGTFMLGYNGKLYTIDSDYQVAVCAPGYAAIGCGRDIAYGAMHVLYDMPHMFPTEKLTKAMDAVCEFSLGCKGPYRFVQK